MVESLALIGKGNPMSDMDAWHEVEKRFETLNQHLRRRFGSVNEDAAAERAVLDQSARGLVTIIEDLLTAADSVLRDRRLHDDVAAVLSALRQALKANFERHSRPAGQPGAAAARGTRAVRDGARVPAAPARPRATTTRARPATSGARRAAPRSRHGG